MREREESSEKVSSDCGMKCFFCLRVLVVMVMGMRRRRRKNE